MKQYVLGFAFSRDRDKVVLIQKQKPDWQRGLFNGIGGKIDPEDASPLDAMYREFKEETGVDIARDDPNAFNNWNHFATMNGKDWVCYCFRTFTNAIFNCKTTEQEEVEIVSISTNLVFFPKISNITWLIHLALDREPKYTEVNYDPETENPTKYTHFLIPDNSDAFRAWLISEGINFSCYAHITAIPIDRYDIFALGKKWALYEQANRPKKTGISDNYDPDDSGHPLNKIRR